MVVALFEDAASDAKGATCMIALEASCFSTNATAYVLGMTDVESLKLNTPAIIMDIISNVIIGGSWFVNITIKIPAIFKT